MDRLIVTTKVTEGVVQYFDTVMTGCCKPAFFTDRNILFAVSEQDSRLSNTDGGAPILPIDQADLPASMPTASSDMEPGHVRTCLSICPCFGLYVRLCRSNCAPPCEAGLAAKSPCMM